MANRDISRFAKIPNSVRRFQNIPPVSNDIIRIKDYNDNAYMLEIERIENGN